MKLSMQNFVFVYPHADGKVMLVTYLRADGGSYVSARGRLCQNEVTYCNFKRVYAYCYARAERVLKQCMFT